MIRDFSGGGFQVGKRVDLFYRFYRKSMIESKIRRNKRRKADHAVQKCKKGTVQNTRKDHGTKYIHITRRIRKARAQTQDVVATPLVRQPRDVLGDLQKVLGLLELEPVGAR